jgi:hypothetical protein
MVSYTCASTFFVFHSMISIFHIHMIRLMVLGLAGFCSLASLHAQQIQASLYLGRKDPKPWWIEYSPKDKGMVTVGPMSKASSRYIGLYKYDEQFNRQWYKQVFEQNGKMRVDHVAVLGDNIVVFVEEELTKEDQLVLWAYQFDLKGNPLANRKEVNRGSRQKKERMELNYSLSLNKKRLLCFQKLGKKGEKEKLKFFVFDEKFKAPSEGGMELPWASEKFVIKSVKVDHQGNVFVLGRAEEADSDGGTPFRHYIYLYSFSDKSAVEIPLDFQNHIVTDLSFRVDKEGNILIGGYFSKSAPGSVGGVFYQKIDGSTLKVSVESYEKFPETFLSRYLSQKQLEKGKELNDFYLDKIIPRSDGGVLLIGEQYYLTSNSFRDVYGFWYTQTFHHYDDVIVTSVSGSGKVEWNSVLYKRQLSESPAQLSYFDVVTGENLFFFYEYREKESGVNVYYQTVGMDGEISKRVPLFADYRPADSFYRVYCEQINNQEAILVYFQQRKKVFTIVRVSF